MKRICLLLSLFLALGIGDVSARHKKDKHRGRARVEYRYSHKHHKPKRWKHKNRGRRGHAVRYVQALPSVGMNVSLGPVNLWFSNGRYYDEVAPSRFEVVMPPIGLVVPRLYSPYAIWDDGVKYYVSDGVVYRPHGKHYKVVRYLDDDDFFDD